MQVFRTHFKYEIMVDLNGSVRQAPLDGRHLRPLSFDEYDMIII